MASFVADGLLIPMSVAGHPALDFCNTRAGWGAPAPKEYLHTHDHLTVWARENGLVTASAVPAMRRAARRDPDGARAVVTRALAWRSALYAVLVGTATPAEWTALNVEVRAAATVCALRPGPPVRWAITKESTVDYPLLVVAWSAAGLLTSPATGHVGACPGEGCGWLFLDPRGRRRWCSMAWCGNRSKARRHAQRRHPETR
jgi:predicted RNA-binding Zn ribbon-like protein